MCTHTHPHHHTHTYTHTHTHTHLPHLALGAMGVLVVDAHTCPQCSVCKVSRNTHTDKHTHTHTHKQTNINTLKLFVSSSQLSPTFFIVFVSPLLFLSGNRKK